MAEAPPDPIKSLKCGEHLTVSFHRSGPVSGHKIPSLQPVYDKVDHVDEPLHLLQGSGKDASEQNTYHLAVQTMDALAIRITVSDRSQLVYKMKIKLREANVIARVPELGQDYLIVIPGSTQCIWVDGMTVQKKPRRVRQFRAIRMGTGSAHVYCYPHSITEQLKLKEEPDFFDIEITGGYLRTEKLFRVPKPLRRILQSDAKLKLIPPNKQLEDGFELMLEGPSVGGMAEPVWVCPETSIAALQHDIQNRYGIACPEQSLH
ncbi:hypothetical protein B0T19DRAFT_147508 [Cercophora scortea]|uniref:Uncharacterized protein n=1 Tax=Cercophora scortea TaxID=314031 RepID=A0AAE0IZM2_9PEZI|nr:hypothetical protein B0T19DRAFT_147508 [Cercophora scortea]